ncbi:MAG TPA: ion transporter [Deferrisomatales bacterium]|nr:ion transporter [Deferrisomatales bacterium]
MGKTPLPAHAAAWRRRLHEVIFEADTPAGKAFDVVLLWLIVASVVVVMLGSVAEIQARYHPWLVAAEWVFTLLFSVEYALRLVCVLSPLRYTRSFFGVVDLLAILPSYLGLLFPGAGSLMVIRSLRLLRVFRVLKLGRYLGEANVLLGALRTSRPKITVFLGTVLTVLVIVATAMYLIEGEANGFTSIPRALYWAVVTMTTVGYGDIAPHTVPGQTLAAAVMVLGYSIIAVPTGIISSELSEAKRKGPVTTQACPNCSAGGHDWDARHCKYCGVALNT